MATIFAKSVQSRLQITARKTDKEGRHPLSIAGQPDEKKTQTSSQTTYDTGEKKKRVPLDETLKLQKDSLLLRM